MFHKGKCTTSFGRTKDVSLDNIKRRQQTVKNISTRVSKLSSLRSMNFFFYGIQLTLIGEDIQNFRKSITWNQLENL
jgi:hypothetical protein